MAAAEQMEPTLGEVIRLLDDLKKKVEDLPKTMAENFVSKELYISERLGWLSRISKLESRQEWLVRAVGGLVLALVFGAILASKASA